MVEGPEATAAAAAAVAVAAAVVAAAARLWQLGTLSSKSWLKKREQQTGWKRRANSHPDLSLFGRRLSVAMVVIALLQL